MATAAVIPAAFSASGIPLAMGLRRFHPYEAIDTACNILVIASADLARRAATDLLMTLQPALKLTGAVVFTHSTDPLLLGNVLPDEVIFRNIDHLHGARLILGMQRDAHRIRAPENKSDTALWKAVQGSNIDRMAVVMDLVNTPGDFRSSVMRDLLFNGRHENIVNIICVSNPSAIPPDIRTNIDFVMLGYTNVVHDIKNAWKSVFGMFESHKDLQDMITDLNDNMLLVAKLNSSGRTLASMLSCYLPDIYQAAPITKHIVENRGKWHMHTDGELALVPPPATPARAQDEDGGALETAQDSEVPQPVVYGDKVFTISSQTIVAIHGAMRDV